jgi:hypothetical protein
MRWAPVATWRIAPAVLPVFDDSWKAECRTCSHLRALTRSERARSYYTIMHCAALGEPHRNNPLSCIDARAEGGACGPDADLHRPAAA